MIGLLIGALAPHIGERYAKPAAWALIIVAVLALSALTWRCVKSDIIEKHDAEQDAEVIVLTQEATSNAVEERGTDVARSAQERSEIKETINEAKAEGRDPRAAYYRCVGLQQQARKAGRPAPAC